MSARYRIAGLGGTPPGVAIELPVVAPAQVHPALAAMVMLPASVPIIENVWADISDPYQVGIFAGPASSPRDTPMFVVSFDESAPDDWIAPIRTAAALTLLLTPADFATSATLADAWSSGWVGLVRIMAKLTPDGVHV